jgi:general secretion pathway protein A
MSMSNTIFNFFGLLENPFRINPDPRFLFITDQTRATADELVYAIQTRKGLILLTGEVGTGKTMLIRRLLDWLAEQKMPTALIFNPHIEPDHLLDFILNDFGVPCASNLKSEKLLALNRWLLERYRTGQTPVLIVDEAQGLDPTALEEIRLLLNFETPREKLLQIILAGQPELEIKLKRHELRQLRQRITIRCRTAPLTSEETYGYIRARLRAAGANGNPIFEPDTVAFIHAYSHGIPRVINVLCEHSLINACADGARTVSPSVVERAARDCQLDRVDSIARILNTSSYSTTSLSDISALFASASAESNPIAEPPSQPRYLEALPARPLGSPYPHVQPSPAAQQITATTSTKNPSENSAIPNEAPLQSAAACDVQAPRAPSQVLFPPSQPRAPKTPLSPSRRSPLDFLRLCGSSFAADARTTSLQFRRAIDSFATRSFSLLVRDLRHELHQLRIRLSPLLLDARWKELRTLAVSASEASWRAFKSAVPPWLTQRLGFRETESRKSVESHASSRPNRRRAILSVRRWLHEPLTTQQKRTHGNPRRSVS